MSAKNRKPWQRFTLSIAGVAIVAGMWRWAIFHLYTLPEHSLPAFTSLTTNCFYVIGAIVIFMVTGKLVYDWKNETTSAVTQTLAQSVEEHIERTVAPKHFDGDDIE